ADESALARLLGGFEGFNGAARSENLLDFRQFTDLVDLPQIKIVGFHGTERSMQITFGAGAGSLGRLRRQKDVLAERRQNSSVNLFRLAVPVDPGIVEIIDPQVV